MLVFVYFSILLGIRKILSVDLAYMNISKSVQPYQYLLVAFIVIEALLFVALHLYTASRSDEYLADVTKRLDTEYHIILNAFDEKAEMAFETMIDTPKIKSLLREGLTAPEPEQKRLREMLYGALSPHYASLKKFGFKQIHFHTPDNRSFLRLHAPAKYGDDLSGFRNTVAFVNQTHQKISGFEEGIASDGYRFVFPLYDEKGYLSSVELSFSAYALTDFLKPQFQGASFIIAKDALVQKEQRYETTPLDPGFVIDQNYIDTPIALNADKRFGAHFDPYNAKPFSLDALHNGQTYIRTFLPVKNPVTHKTDGYMILLSDGKYVHKIQNSFWILFIGLSIIISLLFLRYYRIKKFQNDTQSYQRQLERTNKKLKTILDTQENMIIITDGLQMVDANARVLEFLGYQSFEQLHRHHQCICDFFLKHDDYFHLGHVPDQEHWISYLLKLPPQERVVTMVGADIEPKALQVYINRYDTQKGSYIVTFTDITEMVIREKILQYRAQHDRLTDIYNRQKIDEVLENICGYSSRRNEHAGVILFDIDHFKNINDTYGHDMGDEVLKSIARLVKNNIREEDIFGRWGGEEFILILRHTDLQNSVTKAQILRETIASMYLPDIPAVTASFGVTEVVADDTPQRLLKRIDIALYKAKNEGRNRVVFSSAAQTQPVSP